MPKRVARFTNWKEPKIEHMVPTEWNWVVAHPQHLLMGRYVDIGCFTFINAKQGVVLQEDVQIGPHCSILSVSTIDGKQGSITINEDARIGAHTVIMPGVTIGKHAIVGACSFVNQDIPEGEMWFGVPAKRYIPESRRVRYFYKGGRLHKYGDNTHEQ